MLESWVERLGENGALAAGALLIGVLFGFMAQRSRFCLRSAVIEFARRQTGGKLTVWLFAFATAVGVTQALAWAGWFDAGNARQIAARGSLSGAAIGGALFGVGMILARGCSSRLLVLAAQGNLRSLLSGLVFAVTAQAALTGALSPLRLAISEWWTIDGGGARDLIARSGIGHGGALAFALVWLAAAVFWARRQKVPPWGWAGAIGVGLAIAGAWWFTYAVSTLAFDPHPIQSLSFTGPSAELLNRVLFVSDRPLSFDLGLVPGVFLGSFLAAALFRELKLEGFQGGASMRRYIVGAVCMGFGGMLAGGCAVGAGLSGAAVFTATSWVTLCTMWAAAALTDRLVDQRPSGSLDQAVPGGSASYAAALGLFVCGTLLLQPGTAQAAPDAARGEEIVMGKCFICHGAGGESSSPVFPRLAGQNAAYVARQLADYRSGKRKSSTMQPMVEDLTPDDFKALGAYFSTRPTLVHAIADAELAQMGRFIYLRGNPYSGVAACATCHGANAHGSENLPRLAGQHAQYTENQLKQFNTRERTNDNAVMHGIASKLSELELKAVAAYLSGLQ